MRANHETLTAASRSVQLILLKALRYDLVVYGAIELTGTNDK